MSAIQHDDILVTEDESLKIYVVGYSNQGESIVIVIGDNKFIGVIDCYRTKNEFITKKILEDLKVEQLDFICWTHADWDHTRGLSQLRKYVKNNTAIILPEGMGSREIHNLIYKDDIKDSYKKEFNQIFNMINKVDEDYRLAVNQSSSIFDFNLKFSGSHKKYRFMIEAFAPISGITNICTSETIEQLYNSVIENPKRPDKKWYVEPNRKNNLYSVGLQVILDSNDERVTICLCGDLDDITISKMNATKRNKIFNENTIFKIPHHGSENANALFELKCIDKCEYAVTTSFKRKLPTDIMLKKYKKKCTNLSRTNLRKGTYGLVTYSIALKDLSREEPIYENSAGEYIV